MATCRDTAGRVCPLWSFHYLGQRGSEAWELSQPSGACYWDSSPKKSSAKKRNAGSKPRNDVEGLRARCVVRGSPTRKGRADGKQDKYGRDG